MKIGLCIAVLLSMGAACATSQMASPLTGYALSQVTTSKAGIYWWGGTVGGVKAGYTTGQSKLDSYLTAVGGSVARIFMGASADTAYTGGACLSNPASLTTLAQTATWQTILSDANVMTFIITGYDWASLPDCSTKHYLDPTWFTDSNTASVKTEWQNFAAYLGATYPSKTFILDAWEGDNDCWCGASSTATLINCSAGPTHISGYLLWMQARNAGIKAAGYSNVKTAIEMNDYGPLSSQGLGNILQSVVPNISVDYVSYSSWESKASPATLASDLVAIKRTLATLSGSPTLFIGELGVPDSYSTDSTRMVSYFNVARSLNIPYIIVWELLYDGDGLSYYDTSGNATPFGLAAGAFGP